MEVCQVPYSIGIPYTVNSVRPGQRAKHSDRQTQASYAPLYVPIALIQLSALLASKDRAELMLTRHWQYTAVSAKADDDGAETCQRGRVLSNASEPTVADVRELVKGAGQTQTQQELVDSDSQSETEQDPAQLTDIRPTQGQHGNADRLESRQASDSLAPGLVGDSQEASPAKNKRKRRDDPVSPNKVRKVLKNRLAAMANQVSTSA